MSIDQETSEFQQSELFQHLYQEKEKKKNEIQCANQEILEEADKTIEEVNKLVSKLYAKATSLRPDASSLF